MRTFQVAAALVVTLGATLAFGDSWSTAPASAGTEADEPTEAQGRPEGLLLLSIRPSDQAGVGSSDPASTTDRVLLLCGPDGGSHPHASAACDALREVAGEFVDLPRVDDAICTMEYAPVEVHARGRWEGAPVAYRETFSNRCVASAETDSVFGF